MASNPRALKEVSTLVKLGHEVTVVKSEFENWTKPLERKIEETVMGVKWLKIPTSRRSLKWMLATIVHKLSGYLLNIRDSQRLLAYSLDKRSFLIEWALFGIKDKPRVIIAHNPGAFLPAVAFARKTGAKLGLDIEDFHPGETDDPVASRRLKQLMVNSVSEATVITAASPMILDRTLKLDLYRVPRRQAVIQNVFSLSLQPTFKELPDVPLKLIWFSQNVGLDRGLQDIIKALDLITIPKIHLTILGNCSVEVRKTLESLLLNNFHVIDFVSPVSEPILLEICSEHHIGLAVEPGFSINNRIAMSNKLFTYLLAGNAIVASNTPAQEDFLLRNPGSGCVYQIGDVEGLAYVLRELAANMEKIHSIKADNYKLAGEILNWECESKKFKTIYQLE